MLSITLQRMDLEPRTANSVADAQRLLKTEQLDLCLTDMQLPDGDGLELVKWIQQYSPSVPVAVITAHGNMETAVRALKLGAFDFVSKPLDHAGLPNLVASAIKQSGNHHSDTSVFGPRLLGGIRGDAAHARYDRTRRAAARRQCIFLANLGQAKSWWRSSFTNRDRVRDELSLCAGELRCHSHWEPGRMESELFGHKRRKLLPER